MLNRFVALIVLSLLAGPAAAAEGPQGKTAARELRVLFVGQDPKAPVAPFADLAKPRTYALLRERTAAFEALLRYHFKDVRVVHGADYTAEMSADVDVTVFDALPKALIATRREKNPTTGAVDYRPAAYLPASFDRPALMISHVSPRIGEPLGLKLDWM